MRISTKGGSFGVLVALACSTGWGAPSAPNVPMPAVPRAPQRVEGHSYRGVNVSTGSKSATLVITDDAASSPQAVALVGTAVDGP